MLATKILHIKLLVTVPEKPPPEMIEAYIKGVMASPDKAYKQLKEVLPDVEAVIEKIIKPRIKGHQAFLRADAVTRRGTKVKDSLKPTRAELVRQAKLWLKKTKYAYRHGGKEYAKMVKVMAGLWGEKTLPSLAITGYQDKIRGVGPVAAGCLTNVQTVLPLILPEEFIKKGPLVDITKPGPAEGEACPYGRQGGIFRKRFNSLILSVGRPIIVNNYQPGDIIYANEHINRLVNAFARDEFKPFIPGGASSPDDTSGDSAVASHIDFVTSPETNRLYLDIQVAVK